MGAMNGPLMVAHALGVIAKHGRNKMNNPVEELEDYREVWLSGTVVCVNCSYKWTAVCHVNRQTKIECPECGEMKGVLINES